MRRLRAFVIAVAVIVFGAGAAMASDTVTHAYISERAIDYVRTPELRALLIEQRAALLSGTEFPDWGHGSKPFGEITHSPFLDAYRLHMLRPQTRDQANYRPLVAHYLGVHAHTVQDRLLDATLKKRRKEVGEPRGDDMENGVYAIGAFGYVGLRHPLYLPADDLIAAYQSGGWLEAKSRDPAAFEADMRRYLARQDVGMRGLKLLSFLGWDYIGAILPWGAANLERAPGGLESNARATAAIWEAMWAELNGRPAPFFVYSEPQAGGVLAETRAAFAYGRITVITRRRLSVLDLTPDLVRLTGADGREIPVTIHTYIDVPDHEVDLAFQIQAGQDWRPGERYRLTIAPGPYAPANEPTPASVSFEFAAPTQPQFTAPEQPMRHGYAMGLYLFALVGGIGAVLLGSADLLRLALTDRPRTPLWRAGLTAVTRTLGVSVMGVALWLLATDGAVFIEFLRTHH